MKPKKQPMPPPEAEAPESAAETQASPQDWEEVAGSPETDVTGTAAPESAAPDPLAEACRERGIRLPVHAIGGITENDIPPILATGVSGVALSSLLKNSGDMTTKTTEIINIIRHATIKNSR